MKSNFNAKSQPAPRAVVSDSPLLVDRKYAASTEGLVIISHGAQMNGTIYVAEGSGSHPTVLLLHGLPGYEQNLDLAQSMRRAGWNVLFLHYRGSWGSEGNFSIANCMENTIAGLRFLHTPENEDKYRVDPEIIVVVGHSMGAFLAAYVAAYVAAYDASVSGAALIDPWDIGFTSVEWKANPNSAQDMMERVLPPLHGASADSLITEVTQHAEEWKITNFVPSFKDRPLLITRGQLDGDIESDFNPLKHSLEQANCGQVQVVILPTDHAYSDHRIALQATVISWLEEFKK